MGVTRMFSRRGANRPPAKKNASLFVSEVGAKQKSRVFDDCSTKFNGNSCERRRLRAKNVGLY